MDTDLGDKFCGQDRSGTTDRQHCGDEHLGAIHPQIPPVAAAVSTSRQSRDLEVALVSGTDELARLLAWAKGVERGQQDELALCALREDITDFRRQAVVAELAT